MGIKIAPVKHKPANKIKDGVNLNNFGILVHDMKAIEDFQELSGMSGRYTVEYQHHYIAAIGRIEAEGQILDFAVPLVMYNYEQFVSGGAIEFHLNDVAEANTAALPLAVKKFEEFQETDMFKEITEMGFINWEISGFHSNHQHPTGVDSFSSVDLRDNINNPGVCYPLSHGTNAPNFAGIMQHKEDFSQIIRTEYRIVNAKPDGDKIYTKGRCLSIIRGYENPEPEIQPDLEDGPIDQIFGTSRPKPPPPPRLKNRKSYTLKNQLTGVEGDEIAKAIYAMWNVCPFEIDTTMILKANIKRAGHNNGSKHNQGGRGYNVGGNSHRGKQRDLFDDEYELKNGKMQLVPKERERNKVDRSAVWVEEIEDMCMNLVKYLDYDEEELRTWSAIEIRNTYELEETDVLEEKQVMDMASHAEGANEALAKKARHLLVQDNIMTIEKLRLLKYDDLEELFMETYEMNIQVLEDMQL